MAADPLASALAERFLVRQDAWVVQSPDGRYSARRGRLPDSALAAHLAGRLSLCAYCLAPGAGGAGALWGAFDLDAHAAQTEPDGRLAPAPRRGLFALAGELAGALEALVGGGAVLCEATGGLGAHVWALLAEPCPAPSVCALMDGALARAGLAAGARAEPEAGIVIERYPKSVALGEGQLGSALRLPFGVHPRGRRRSVAFDPATGALRDPLGCLTAARGRVTARRLAAGLRRAGLCPTPSVSLPRTASSARPPAPDAWLTYCWAAARLGLSDRTGAPPPAGASERGHPVRCLFPAAHAHGDLGAGSAYLIRRGEVQIYGCAVCEGGMAIDTIALVRRVEPGLTFPKVLERCHEIDPVRCPSGARAA